MKKTSVIFLCLIIIFYVLFPCTVSGATTGSFSVSVSSSNINVGSTANLSISVTNCEGRFLITSSNSDVVSVSSSSDWIDGASSYTLTAKNEGTATITVVADDVGDNQTPSQPVTGSKTVSITVSQPYTPPPSTDPEPPVVSEPNFTSVNQTVYATTEVNVRSSYSTSSGSIGSLQEGDSVTRTGIGDNGWSRVSYNGSTGYIFSQYLTTTAPTVDNEDDNEEDNPVKSSNNYLKSLTVNNGTLSPNFNSRTTSYTVVVEDDLEEITISAEPEDEKATVSGAGTIHLEEGNTTARIEVVAENGSTNTYTIHIRKESAEEIIPVGIKSLKIQGVTVDNKTEDISFMPDFKTEVTEYTCNVSDQITKLLITAEPNEEGMTIEILGNENLQMGENVITILVKSEDGQEIYTYQIIVTKGEVAPTSRYRII